MIKPGQYSNIKIARLKTVFYILLLLSVQPAFSQARIINNITLQDTTKQDTVFVKPDSILKKTPQKIFSEDTTFQNFMKSPWEMSESTMNQYFYEDLGDLLNYFPGNYLLDFGSSGQSLVSSHHGANNKQITLFFDERPFYDPIYGGIDLNLIPVGFTKSITIEQGLSSHFVTSNAELISLKSANYEDDTPYSQVSYHKAPYGFSDVDVIFGQRISKKANLLLGGIIKSYNGKTNSYNFEQQNFRGKVEYDLLPACQFKYSWISNKINRHIPNPILTDTLYQLTDASQKVSRLDHSLNIKGRIFKSDFKNFQANLFYSSLSDKLKDKRFEFQSTNLSRYAGLNFQLQNRFLGQRITSGVDLTHEWTGADQVGKNKRTFGSIFIQDDWNWNDQFGLRILGNYGIYNIHGSQLSGGVSSFFSLTKNFRISTSANQSFCHPTFFELNAKTNFIGNSDLKPETHKKIELGVEWQVESKFSLKGSLYHKNILNVIQFSPLDSLKATFLNQNNLQYSGVDFQLRWAFLSKFQLLMLFSTIENNRLDNQPEIMFTGYLQYTDSFFKGDLRPRVRIEGRYFGERKSTALHPYYYELYQINLSPVFVLNAQAILNFGNLKIFITLENILDKKYELIYGYPMNERTLHYGLRWEFWN